MILIMIGFGNDICEDKYVEMMKMILGMMMIFTFRYLQHDLIKGWLTQFPS